MNNFKELKVWQKAIDLVALVYGKTQAYPKEELYGLTSQIRRAAVSIPSNISEGAGRISNKDFSHFLNIARGSSYELETQLIISLKLKYLKESEFRELTSDLDEVQRMLTGLQKSLKNA